MIERKSTFILNKLTFKMNHNSLSVMSEMLLYVAPAAWDCNSYKIKAFPLHIFSYQVKL